MRGSLRRHMVGPSAVGTMLTDASSVEITAIATVALVIGTLSFEWLKHRRERIVTSANTLTRLLEYYDSLTFLRKSRQISELLFAAKPISMTSEVPDFFERIGLLLTMGVLDTEMVWDAFRTPVLFYWQALRWPTDHFATYRAVIPRAFENFDRLYGELLRVECAKSGRPPEQAFPQPDLVRAFLKSEVELAARAQSTA